jgi:hypothetical protein
MLTQIHKQYGYSTLFALCGKMTSVNKHILTEDNTKVTCKKCLAALARKR